MRSRLFLSKSSELECFRRILALSASRLAWSAMPEIIPTTGGVLAVRLDEVRGQVGSADRRLG